MTTTKKQVTLVPQYMNEFQCIGSECEDSCCVGWKVNIDKTTYKKYKKSRDLELKTLFEKKLSRNRSTPSEANYASIKMEQGGACPFLSEEKLCKVHSTLGEDYLSNTCATYPRVTNRVNGVLERSATVSCPEAARLALLNPEGIIFDEVEEPREMRGTISKDLHPKQESLINYLWEFRIFTIQVLQNREYTLADRLIILGLFYKKVQQKMDEGSSQADVLNEIERYTNYINSGTFKEELANITPQNFIQLRLAKSIVDLRFSQGISSSRFTECLKEFLVGLEFTSEATNDEVEERYNEAYSTYYEPFMDEHEYILENYLVNYVYKNLFPLGRKSVSEDFIMLVVHYSMIKLILIGMSRHHKGLTTELVIKVIQSFAKTVEHNNGFLDKVYSILEEEGYATMGHMAILIKN